MAPMAVSSPLPRMAASLLATMLFCACQVHSSQLTASSLPINGWEGSFAASCAQSTAMALPCREGCAVVVLVSPKSNVFRPKLADDGDPVEVQDVSVRRVRAPGLAFAPPWMPYGSGTLLTMTGLATDVEHLTRVLQKRESDHLNTFDEENSGNRLLRYLTSYLREGSSDRPYAIQGIMVNVKATGVHIVSLDPSGAWQSWGRGTAVGRKAKSVRDELAAILDDESSTAPTPKHAIEMLLRAWCEGSGGNLDDNKDEFEILVVWSGESTEGMQIGSFEDIEAIKERIKTKVEEEELEN